MDSVIKMSKGNKQQGANILLLFFGQLVSLIGDNVFVFGVGLYILELTGKATIMSSYVGLGILVLVLSGPLGGILSDRYSKVKLIYIMDYIRGFAVTLMVLALLFISSNTVILVSLFSLNIIINICSSIFTPATMAIIPEIVQEENLTKANSMISSSQQLARILGLILGGILYGTIGILGIVIINAVTYLVSGISEMYIKPLKESIKKESKNPVTEMIDTLKETNKDKTLRTMIIYGCMINFLMTPFFSVFIPYIFKITLNTKDYYNSFAQATFSIGMIIGVIVISKVRYEEKAYIYLKTCMMAQCIIGFFIPILLHYNIKNSINFMIFYSMIIVVLIGIGIFNAGVNVPFMVFVQTRASKENIGKVMALINTLMGLAIPLGVLLGGIMVDYISIVQAMIIQSSLFLLVIITGVFNKSLNEFKIVKKE